MIAGDDHPVLGRVVQKPLPEFLYLLLGAGVAEIPCVNEDVAGKGAPWAQLGRLGVGVAEAGEPLNKTF